VTYDQFQLLVKYYGGAALPSSVGTAKNGSEIATRSGRRVRARLRFTARFIAGEMNKSRELTDRTLLIVCRPVRRGAYRLRWSGARRWLSPAGRL